MHSTNPVLSRADTFTRGGYATFRTSPDTATQTLSPPETAAPVATRPMTIDDVVTKTGILLAVTVITGAAAWALNLSYGWALGAMLVGLVLAIVNSVKKVVSPPLVMAYAAVEGVFVGVLSHVLNDAYDNIVIQAVLGTGLAFAAMLGLYRSGRIRVTPRFQKILMAAALGYMGFLLLNLVFMLFGAGANLWAGPIGLLTAGIGVTLASLFLALDFDLVEKMVQAGVPEQESWRAAFGLLVTLVWLYIEMLRLLAVLRGEE